MPRDRERKALLPSYAVVRYGQEHQGLLCSARDDAASRAYSRAGRLHRPDRRTGRGDVERAPQQLLAILTVLFAVVSAPVGGHTQALRSKPKPIASGQLTSLPAPSRTTSWAERDHPFTPDFLDCLSGGFCQGVGSDGSVALSHDGGMTWQVEALPRANQPGGEGPTFVVCPSAEQCWLAGSSALGSATAPKYLIATSDGGRDWETQALPGRGLGLGVVDALACPTPIVCVGVGEQGVGPETAYVVRTDDAGGRWVLSKVGDTTPALQQVVCPTSSKCLALGYGNVEAQANAVLLSSNDGGRGWQRLALPKALWRVGALACSSARSCVLVGNAAPRPGSPWISPGNGGAISVGGPLAAVTGDGGASWALVAMPAALVGPTQVTCVSSGSCWAEGQTAEALGAVLVRSTDGGRSWARLVLPGRADAVSPLDCLDESHCYLPTPAGIFTSKDGGEAWRRVPQGPGLPVDLYDTPGAVACPSTLVCVVTTRWMALAGASMAPPFPLAFYTKDGGVSWSASKTVSGNPQSSAVSCATTSRCWAVTGNYIMSTTDGGMTWATDHVLATSRAGFLSPAISCPTTASCIVVGLQNGPSALTGRILITSDGGRTWAARRAPTGDVYLDALSCASRFDCWAAGSRSSPDSSSPAAILATLNGGTTWTLDKVPPASGALSGISCPTSRECVAVGTSDRGTAEVLRTIDAGSSWAAASGQPGAGPLNAVSCPIPGYCVAVGSDAAIYSDDGGRHWGFEPLPSDTSLGLTGVSCSTTNDCVAVGMYSILSTFHGGRALQ